jgi:hypothetical protein
MKIVLTLIMELVNFGILMWILKVKPVHISKLKTKMKNMKTDRNSRIRQEENREKRFLYSLSQSWS